MIKPAAAIALAPPTIVTPAETPADVSAEEQLAPRPGIVKAAAAAFGGPAASGGRGGGGPGAVGIASVVPLPHIVHLNNGIRERRHSMD